MDAVVRAQERVDELRGLLVEFRVARAAVPSLSRAAGAVGAVGSWTGAVAERLQRDELGPLAGGLGDGLRLAEQALEDELAHARRTRDRVRSEVDEGEGRVPV